MSTNSELKARFARLGPVRDADPPPLFSGDPVTLVLRLVGPLDKPISVAKRLRAAGLTLRAAHAVINRLAETQLGGVSDRGGREHSYARRRSGSDECAHLSAPPTGIRG